MSSSGPGSAEPIRVLVVDDSASSRALLVGMLNADARVQVVGIAADGEAAVAAAHRLKPDVITMDIHLPKLDGFAATRRIMESCPTRIVMVTSSSLPDEVASSFQALESGALAVLGKPPGPGHSQFAAAREELLRTVTLMAEVPVVRRWPAAGRRANELSPPLRSEARDVGLVVIGASTGGPLALQAILSRLRPGFRAPIVIVQHISLGFADGLVQWLTRSSGYEVRVAADGDALRPGVAYVAPDEAQTTVHGSGHIVLTHAPAENGFRPSVATLFRSAAEQYGGRAVGILLTGMGHDGARELKALRDAGALTMVQDSESAAIYGMPGEAVRLGAAMHVLSPEAIAATLNRLVEAEGSR
ncbi:chemotaxis-specific protein-glutamate methyltransferase CheB [Piscinibacter sp. XHJ-5]|uniref:chemotaxis-specific protein-glutamate methyltransferase CheB n=1 Tax=Piscinibacter sp. XHJ-5 TaxID=3037797 RepID=UPI002452DC36|nr:chemotaxis-specific protein-glutamate methyltransferase CheB [Piscinibacter sp. XHJ-5]